ncbi:hypothetical protein QVD99_000663 [Batrachochytrium dendrobatidis]|nr:hypothetical protein O5D80_003515 [Batrachochytrium dendrobatidis]KAK5673209.1 hypothetical protein QVD99_000663 [Batrachochytrium dendrobatidis]
MASNGTSKTDGKPSSYKFRRNLEFEAQGTPNFLKILQNGGVAQKTDYGTGTSAEVAQRAMEAEEEQWLKEEAESSTDSKKAAHILGERNEDEQPQIVVGKGVTALEVDQFFGTDQSRVMQNTTDDMHEDEGKIRYRKPKRSQLVNGSTHPNSTLAVLGNKQKKQTLKGLVSSKDRVSKSKSQSKSLLSFDDTE